MSTSVKIYTLQPQLDVPAQSRIRFPLWLKCLYNIAQMELTTLDPLGAFYLVALDTDWALRPFNINPDGSIRPRPVFSMPLPYPTNAAAGRIGAYTIAYQKFDQQQRVKSDLHSAICTSLGSITLNGINSKHPFGTGSLSPLDLVKELKSMFGNITKQEIDTTQAIISVPLGNFLDFRDFCSNIQLNYEFLSSAGHNIPELTRIDSFMHSIQPFTQFDPYLTTWTTANALGTRTLLSLTDFLLDQYGDMPTENAPRGGNAFFVGKGRGKGKYKGKDPKGRGRGTKRGRDSDSDTTSLPSFNSTSSGAPAPKNPRLTSNTVPALTPEHNPNRPYNYCFFHGSNFSHRGTQCKRIAKSGDQSRINATTPTGTTPPGSTYVEPAYKSWL